MEQIVLLGGGGHTASVMDSIVKLHQYEIAGYVDRDHSREKDAGKLPLLGTDQDLETIYRSGIRNAFITVGYMGTGTVRERLFRQLKQIGYHIPRIIDPSAVIADHVKVGEGAYIGKKAVVNAAANIGMLCIINTGAIVEHNNSIGDFSHVAVGSVLCGNVKTGKRVFIGANATVIQGIEIGSGAVVGAGVTVRHDLAPGQVYYGT